LLFLGSQPGFALYLFPEKDAAAVPVAQAGPVPFYLIV